MYFVYGLIDPFSKELRYIGKAKHPRKRLSKHLCPSRLKSITHKNNWIKFLIKNGSTPELIILQECDTETISFEVEIELIEYYRYIGSDLTNSTNGGEGSSGRKMSEKHSIRLKEIISAPKTEAHKEKIRKSHYGIKPSLETREKLRLSKIRENNPRAKLNKVKIKQIKTLFENNVSIKEIMKLFSISRRTASSIKNNHIWNY